MRDMKTIQRNDLKELLDVVERLRNERYPTLSADLVAQILVLEDQYFEERDLARRAVERLVDEHLKQGATSSAETQASNNS